MELLTPEQVADILQITVTTVRRYIREGQIKASKLGRVWRVRADELERFVKDREQET